MTRGPLVEQKTHINGRILRSLQSLLIMGQEKRVFAGLTSSKMSPKTSVYAPNWQISDREAKLALDEASRRPPCRA
jgi:hypothetical protein